MSDEYKTIESVAEGLWTERKSRFLSFLIPADSVESVKKYLSEYRKKYYNARHICWAYVLGSEGKVFRSNDDGEPSSTAGIPILNVIRSYGLTNVLLIVVRYFGGIKLGTSCLAAAYKIAAKDVVSRSHIVEKTVDEKIIAFFKYGDIDRVMKIVKKTATYVVDQDFDIQCSITLRVRRNLLPALKSELLRIKNLKFSDKDV